MELGISRLSQKPGPPLFREVHFYLVHRLIHWPPLYRAVHSLHHNNANPGPWSGLAMHPVEHVLYSSAVLLHWVVPWHPLHVIFHLQHLGLAPAQSHAGFDQIVVNANTTVGGCGRDAADRSATSAYRVINIALEFAVQAEDRRVAEWVNRGHEEARNLPHGIKPEVGVGDPAPRDAARAPPVRSRFGVERPFRLHFFSIPGNSSKSFEIPGTTLFMVPTRRSPM